MVCATRAICEPLRRQMVDSTASLCTVLETVHNDAVESTVCRLSGSQRVPCEQWFAWSACACDLRAAVAAD
eukprot:11015314-Lingulodinium_polyedra.AAC.1